MQCHNNVSYAGAGVRFCAYIIDQIILLMVIGMVSGVLGILGLLGLDVILEYEILFHFTVTAIIYYVIKKIYFIAFTYTSGQTIGKRIFRIKVVNDDLSKVNFWRVFYREIIGRYLCDLKIFVWIGYLVMALDEEKRGVHDRLSDTRVVYDETINNEEVLETQQFYQSEKSEDKTLEDIEKAYSDVSIDIADAGILVESDMETETNNEVFEDDLSGDLDDNKSEDIESDTQKEDE